MSIAAVFVMAALLLLASFAAPVAARVRLPCSVPLAVIGVAIGLFGAQFAAGGGAAGDSMAGAIANLPVNSDAFIFVFPPALLFQSAMPADARQVMPRKDACA